MCNTIQGYGCGDSHMIRSQGHPFPLHRDARLSHACPPAGTDTENPAPIPIQRFCASALSACVCESEHCPCGCQDGNNGSRNFVVTICLSTMVCTGCFFIARCIHRTAYKPPGYVRIPNTPLSFVALRYIRGYPSVAAWRRFCTRCNYIVPEDILPPAYSRTGSQGGKTALLQGELLQPNLLRRC